mgnify:CR=1 FL=1
MMKIKIYFLIFGMLMLLSSCVTSEESKLIKGLWACDFSTIIYKGDYVGDKFVSNELIFDADNSIRFPEIRAYGLIKTGTCDNIGEWELNEVNNEIVLDAVSGCDFYTDRFSVEFWRGKRTKRLYLKLTSEDLEFISYKDFPFDPRISVALKDLPVKED